MSDVEKLIERSRSHNEIVFADYDPGLAAELRIRCEDWTEGVTGQEFWGADWRVHLRFEDADE